MPPSHNPSLGEPVLEVLDALVPPELHAAAWTACGASRWKFGHGSHESDSLPFWKLELDGDPAIAEIWERVRERCAEIAGAPLRVIRVYANGHTYGLGGKAHSDDARPGTFTLLYYPMPAWKEGWDGETVYYDSDGEIALAVRPRPNRGVFFDSRIAHEGRPPSRACNALRVTIAFKLEIAAAATNTLETAEVVEVRRDGALRVYSVRIPAAALERATREQLLHLGQSVRLPGYRPGKIPEGVLAERYGGKARGAAVDRLAGEALERAVPKGRVPASVELKAGGAAGDLEIHATVTLLADLPQPDLSALHIVRLTAGQDLLESLGIVPDVAARRLREDVKRQALDFLNDTYRFPLRPELVDGELAAILKAADGQAMWTESESRDAFAANMRGIAERRLRLGFVIAELARRFDIRSRNGAEVEDRVIEALIAQAVVVERPATAGELREIVGS
jgi:SM-20-related protein